MDGARAATVNPGFAKGSWSEIFGNGLGLYSALVIGGIAMNATQMLVIAIIMPTIVRDIGGASFYTWAAMPYTIGAIVVGAWWAPSVARWRQTPARSSQRGIQENRFKVRRLGLPPRTSP